MRLSIVAVMLSIVLLAGCKPPSGALEGVVEFEGEPVKGGFVMLFPTNGNYRQASSVKIVDGRYRITGIVPGEKRLSLDSLSLDAEQAGVPGRPVPFDRASVPETITVAAGPQTRDFVLKRAGGKPASGSR